MIVHLRNPLQLRREIGTGAMLRFINMTGGIPTTAVMNLVFGLLLLTWVSGRPQLMSLIFPSAAYYVFLTLFLVATPFSLFVGLMLAHASGKPHLWWAALLAPLYWVLQSLAALKAFYQLVFRPSFWEKTVHGLSGPATVVQPAGSTL
jgi:hypothetical protein